MNTEDKDKRLDGDTESLQNDGADAFGSEIFGELEFKEVVVPVEKAEHLYGRGVSPGTQAPQGNAGHSTAAGRSAAGNGSRPLWRLRGRKGRSIFNTANR